MSMTEQAKGKREETRTFLLPGEKQVVYSSGSNWLAPILSALSLALLSSKVCS